VILRPGVDPGYRRWTHAQGRAYFLALPKWKLLRKLKMRWQITQTTRRCPYNCSFCIAPRELGRGNRLQSIDSTITDIKYQQELVGTKYFFIVDNHFTIDWERTEKLLSRIIEEKINWCCICFTRLEVARDEELLRLLKKAQVNTLYMGLESFDDGVLKLLNKAQTGENLKKALKTIKAHGLRVFDSFVLGCGGDTVETIRAAIDAAVEEDVDYVALFPLSGYTEIPPPGHSLEPVLHSNLGPAGRHLRELPAEEHEAQHLATGGQSGL